MWNNPCLYFETLDRKYQLLTILTLGYQRLHPKLLRILLPMNFRSHIRPLKGSYGLRSHLQWTSLKLLWISVATLLLEWMELNKGEENCTRFF
jgi:hypothetical protein